MVYLPIIKSLSRAIQVELFPRPFEQYALKRTNLIGAEIGVFKGKHAESLLNNCSLLYLVDPYTDTDYNEISFGDLYEAKSEAKKLLRNKKVSFIYESSKEASLLVPNNLDFVYIDANHELAKEDISIWWPKIVSEGVIGGHDFDNGIHDSHSAVVKDIIEFSVNNNLKLFVQSPDWWIIKP